MNSEAEFVQEFNAYPSGAQGVSRLMDMGYGVIMIDVDSDEKHALSLVESISALGSSVIVMVYSRRNDPDLLMRCMRAGAREFLPLPADEDAPPAEKKSQPAQHVPEPAIEHTRKPAEPVPATAARAELRPVEVFAAEPEAPAQPAEEVPAASSPDNDFNEWDKTWVMSAMPLAKGLRSTMRTVAAPEAPAKVEPKRAVVHSITEIDSRPAEKSEYVERPLFHPLEDDQVIKPDRGWIKWLLIAGGVAAAIGIVLLVFMRPSKPSAAAAAQVEYVAPQQQSAPEAQAANTANTASPIAKPSPQGAASTAQSSAAAAPVQAGKQVSSAEMDAQLAAPSRISIKQPAAVGDAPADLAPVALDSGGSIPGAVFGGNNKAKVVPSVSAISAGVAEGMLIHRTAPIYPRFAQETHIGGTVVLKATITKNGTLANVHVVSGPTVLISAAVDAVKTWRYRPYLLNNQPVDVDTTIDLIFNIGQH